MFGGMKKMAFAEPIFDLEQNSRFSTFSKLTTGWAILHTTGGGCGGAILLGGDISLLGENLMQFINNS